MPGAPAITPAHVCEASEVFWNAGFWDMPRGLAAVLDTEDEIGEVTQDYIEIWKLRRDRQRFMGCVT
jgi:hypothetical protein